MQRFDPKQIYVFLLILSAFISISVFEIFVGIGLFIVIYEFFKYKKLDGCLKTSILIFGGVSILSTILYAPKMITKSIEEGFFQFLYFFQVKVDKDFIQKLIVFFIIIGILLLPVVVYNYYKTSYPLPVWGSRFETGQFYGMFAIMSYLFAFYLYKQKDKRFIFFLILSILFFVILVSTHRRSPLMGFMIVSYLSFFVLYKNNLIKKISFWIANILLIISLLGSYVYLSKTDYRFKTFNEVLLGKKEIDFQTLNIISSSRVKIGIDAINIVKDDIENRRLLNLLIGHGVRSGYYLPHKLSARKYTKYESFFLISEFIEKGVVGVIAILAIFVLTFKKFVTLKIRESFDIVTLGFFVPLLIHFIGSIFTFFWDALLPMYLLLFKIGEIYFNANSEIKLK